MSGGAYGEVHGGPLEALAFPRFDTSLNDLKERMRFRASVPERTGIQPWVARTKFAQKVLPFESKLPPRGTKCDGSTNRTDLLPVE